MNKFKTTTQNKLFSEKEEYCSKTSLNWLREKYISEIEIFEYHDYDDEIFLDTIVIKEEKRGYGHGTNFMTDLCDYADKHKKIISLVPSNLLGTSIIILEKFYRRFGFSYGKEVYNKNFLVRDYRYVNSKKTK